MTVSLEYSSPPTTSLEMNNLAFKKKRTILQEQDSIHTSPQLALMLHVCTPATGPHGRKGRKGDNGDKGDKGADGELQD